MSDVTVLLPVYNGMPYLPIAVDSILGQTLKDFVFFIINDGSTDETANYLNEINDPRVKVVHQQNMGLGRTLNRGISICNTTFLARMDADDISMPKRLEAQLDFLISNPEVGAVGTQIEYFTNNINHTGFPPPMKCKHDDIYKSLFDMGNSFIHPSLMFRIGALKKIGGYQINSHAEDLDMFLRLGEVSKLANMKEVLHLMRLHRESVTSNQWRKCNLQAAYAVDCAMKRKEGKPERSYEEFFDKYMKKPLWKRVGEELDITAFNHYRKATIEILDGRRTAGLLRMIFASILSPVRTASRVKRELVVWNERR